jgi:hypothetical protein
VLLELCLYNVRQNLEGLALTETVVNFDVDCVVVVVVNWDNGWDG